jgi:hypothetical protein
LLKLGVGKNRNNNAIYDLASTLVKIIIHAYKIMNAAFARTKQKMKNERNTGLPRLRRQGKCRARRIQSRDNQIQY